MGAQCFFCGLREERRKSILLLPTEQSWASHLTSLGFNLLICEKGMKYQLRKVVFRKYFIYPLQRERERDHEKGGQRERQTRGGAGSVMRPGSRDSRIMPEPRAVA